jgi:integrase
MNLPDIAGIAPAEWWRALIVVAYNTGLRRRALFSLRMDEIDWQGERLVLPPERLKSHRPQIIHLNATTLEHLRRIQGGRELIFPTKWHHEQQRFYPNFYRLQALAGVPSKDRFGLHVLRKTHGTLLWEQSPQAAQFSLGHTAMAITKASYIDGGPMVARAIDALPQPFTIS